MTISPSIMTGDSLLCHPYWLIQVPSSWVKLSSCAFGHALPFAGSIIFPSPKGLASPNSSLSFMSQPRVSLGSRPCPTSQPTPAPHIAIIHTSLHIWLLYWTETLEGQWLRLTHPVCPVSLNRCWSLPLLSQWIIQVWKPASQTDSNNLASCYSHPQVMPSHTAPGKTAPVVSGST